MSRHAEAEKASVSESVQHQVRHVRGTYEEGEVGGHSCRGLDSCCVLVSGGGTHMTLLGSEGQQGGRAE